MAQIALCEDIDAHDAGWIMYRHSETDETKAEIAGRELPPPWDTKRGGTWEALAADNLDKNGTILTFIDLIGAASGPLVEFKAGFIAESEVLVNLRGDVGVPELKQGGLYRIGQVTFAKRKGDEAPHICVVRVGEMDPKKLIYEIRLA